MYLTVLGTRWTPKKWAFMRVVAITKDLLGTGCSTGVSANTTSLTLTTTLRVSHSAMSDSLRLNGL